MEIVLWITCSVLAFAFLASGFVKAFLPIKEVRKMPWSAEFSDLKIRLIGVAEILGAVGLIAPLATGIFVLITPIAAICLAVLMFGATRTHKGINDPRSASVTTTTLMYFALAVAVLALIPRA